MKMAQEQVLVVEQEVAPAPQADPLAAGFFDIDNTLMRGACVYHFARGLAARRYFTTSDLVRFSLQQLRFRMLASEHRGHIAQAKEKALAFVAGRQAAELRRLCEEIYDEFVASRIWSGTQTLAQQHLDAGQRVWLVTAAPVEFGAVIASRLGLTGAIGTVAEIRGCHYTGRLINGFMHGPAKAAAIRSLAEREGIDLSLCTAYSDSVNDLPMLGTVGRAVAVNPDPALRRVARERDWEIHDFRARRKMAYLALWAGVVGATIALTGRGLHRAVLGRWSKARER